MINLEITHEAESLLKLLYVLYRSRREEGKGRLEASYIGSSDEIKQNYLNQMSFDDVSELCFELAEQGCITYSVGDDIASEICLTRKALVYCEQVFQRDTKNLIEWISSIKGILPF